MNIEDKVRYLINLEETDIYNKVVEEVQLKIINTTLLHFYGNQTKAASVLGINRGTLKQKLIKNKKEVTPFKFKSKEN
jgi:Fis family transcriptional regulator